MINDRSDPSGTDDLYREVILDHYREPKGREPITGATMHSEGLNPVCGDECELEARIKGGVIEAIHVGGRGCSISVASGSILAELIRGKTVAQAERFIAATSAMMRGEALPEDLEIGDLEVLAGLKDYPVRVKCALLAWKTLASGLAGRAEAVSTENL